MQLLAALISTGKPIILVLVHGRPVTFGPDNHLLDGVDVVLATWIGGEETVRAQPPTKTPFVVSNQSSDSDCNNHYCLSVPLLLCHCRAPPHGRSSMANSIRAVGSQ
jgi:hypothetical protein